MSGGFRGDELVPSCRCRVSILAPVFVLAEAMVVATASVRLGVFEKLRRTVVNRSLTVVNLTCEDWQETQVVWC